MAEPNPTAIVGRRVGGFLIDFLVAGVIYWGLFFLMAEERSSQPTDSIRAYLSLGDTAYAITGGKAALFFLIFLLLGFAYWSVLPGVTGWTLGKLATRTRVVGEDGRLPAGIWRNVARQAMGVADYFPYILPGLTGFIVALSTRDHRRVGDIVAKTYVVKKQAAGRPLATQGPPATPSAAVPSTAAAPPTTPPAAGWYPDPHGHARLRWWDGEGWTDHTAA